MEVSTRGPLASYEKAPVEILFYGKYRGILRLVVSLGYLLQCSFAITARFRLHSLPSSEILHMDCSSNDDSLHLSRLQDISILPATKLRSELQTPNLNHSRQS